MDEYGCTSSEAPREERERLDASGNTPLAAALAYGGAGLPVFPCRPDKRPLISAWPTEASTDADVIRGWWETWPNAMIGLVTGARSGLYVVDIDVKEGRDGMAAYRALKVPTARIAARTPSGGGHAYFRWPGSGWGNTASKIAPGIDSRGEGGYVIVPPSAGGEYRWLTDAMGEALLGGNVPELPEVLRVILTPAPELAALVPNGRARSSDRWADRAIEKELTNVRSAAAGNRNDTLNIAAFNLGQIVAGGHLKRST